MDFAPDDRQAIEEALKSPSSSVLDYRLVGLIEAKRPKRSKDTWAAKGTGPLGPLS